MILWRYVIVTDGGAAPNFDPPLTTLAICKPMIRKGARCGDLVMAFAGKPIARNPHKVVWAGIVREKLSFEQYWRDARFQTKKPNASKHPDNIYRGGATGLKQVRNGVHGPQSAATDERGQFVLVLKPAWHLDLEISSLPEQFSNLQLTKNNRRGHRRSEIQADVAKELLAWLTSRAHRKARVKVIDTCGQPGRRASKGKPPC
jgi:hypothetical protein